MPRRPVVPLRPPRAFPAADATRNASRRHGYSLSRSHSNDCR
ncbi:hypothetical protein C7S15_8405 [Burkholderia cepacia]|nr:hypothetical protein [Burkholderia cepacia]